MSRSDHVGRRWQLNQLSVQGSKTADFWRRVCEENTSFRHPCHSLTTHQARPRLGTSHTLDQFIKINWTLGVLSPTRRHRHGHGARRMGRRTHGVGFGSGERGSGGDTAGGDAPPGDAARPRARPRAPPQAPPPGCVGVGLAHLRREGVEDARTGRLGTVAPSRLARAAAEVVVAPGRRHARRRGDRNALEIGDVNLCEVRASHENQTGGRGLRGPLRGSGRIAWWWLE